MISVLVVHVVFTKQNKTKRKKRSRSSFKHKYWKNKKSNKQTVREITHHGNGILPQKIYLYTPTQ